MNQSSNTDSQPIGKDLRGLRLGGLPVLATVIASLVLLTGCAGADDDAGADAAKLRALLSSEVPSLMLEVDSVEGLTLSSAAQDETVSVFSELTGKTGEIEVTLDDTFEGRGEDGSWDWSSIRSLSTRLRDIPSTEAQATVHVLLLDGQYAGSTSDGSVLGLAEGHDLVVLFEGAIRQSCERVAAEVDRGQAFEDRLCDQTQLAVLVHEYGHILGLVNSGTPMVEPHEDPDSPGHDTVSECVMDARFNSQAAVDEIRGQLMQDEDPGVHFCDRCREDLASFRNALDGTDTTEE
jgi:hypothetical protein